MHEMMKAERPGCAFSIEQLINMAPTNSSLTKGSLLGQRGRAAEPVPAYLDKTPEAN